MGRGPIVTKPQMKLCNKCWHYYQDLLEKDICPCDANYPSNMKKGYRVRKEVWESYLKVKNERKDLIKELAKI
ncbi:MAG: hypothetical protein GYA60_02445 [Candidatus Methanofastidiosa archaeon]|nr:hypothetical protein [Candidatus Methanofastidiosa archaeon]